MTAAATTRDPAPPAPQPDGSLPLGAARPAVRPPAGDAAPPWWRRSRGNAKAGKAKTDAALAPYLPWLDAVDALEPPLAAVGDRRLDARAADLRRRAAGFAESGNPLDDLLPETFALVRELARRELGQRPYAEQMLAGIALHGPAGELGVREPAARRGAASDPERRGTLVEMQTGEGKTLAAVAPVALAALAGGGAHVLTYNDYLARRDAAWMGPVYRRLGLSVAAIQEGMTPRQRQRAYGCDVTYLTVKEAGFDLLRDGLCFDPANQVHRPFRFALVDEADSLLIDEARIPLVIAGDVDEPAQDLERLAAVARRLDAGVHFAVDEHGHNIFLTDAGVHRAEALLACGNLFSAANVRLQAELRNALHAAALLHCDVDYIVRGGRVELVDELTGRVAEDRHWPDGLQAALEAKEGLRLRAEGRILGTLAIQDLLRLYPRLAGMTATARAAAAELRETYGLAVLTLPTHRPCVRVDHEDRIYATRAAQRRAVVDEITRVHASGRPILVGTVSVGESESLAAELAAAGVPCRVLNARNDAEEAEIVAEAGAPGAVTISTNMAGRGTDIRLGGADEAERRRVVELEGLYVLGTHRHESRRIDDQLRGRAGRQGDPGASRFFLSLDDNLLRRYGIDRLLPKGLRDTGLRDAGLREEVAADGDGGNADPARSIDHPRVRREVARVQRIVEGEHGDVRRRLLSYARLLELQRQAVQGWRQAVLEERGGENVDAPTLAESCPERWNDLVARCGEDLLREVERRVTLAAIDRCWSDHLADLQAARDEIHLVQLDGRDPLAELYRLAGAAFEALIQRIDEVVVETFEALEVTPDGVDWDAAGLRAPSSTWTYLVNDNVFGGNAFLTLSTRASFGFLGVLLLWPVLLLWGVGEKWRRWRVARKVPIDSP